MWQISNPKENMPKILFINYCKVSHQRTTKPHSLRRESVASLLWVSYFLLKEYVMDLCWTYSNTILRPVHKIKPSCTWSSIEHFLGCNTVSVLSTFGSTGWQRWCEHCSLLSQLHKLLLEYRMETLWPNGNMVWYTYIIQ